MCVSLSVPTRKAAAAHGHLHAQRLLHAMRGRGALPGHLARGRRLDAGGEARTDLQGFMFQYLSITQPKNSLNSATPADLLGMAWVP